MMVRSALVCKLLPGIMVAVTLAACTSTVARAPVERRSPTQAASPRPAPTGEWYKVRRGDTLYGIAWAHDLDYRQLAAWNGIRSPYTIYPGRSLRVKPAPRTSTSRSGGGAPVRAPRTQGQSTKVPVTPVSKSQPSTSPHPTSGSRPRRKPAPEQSERRRLKPSKKTVSIPSQNVSAPTQSNKLTWAWPTKGKVVKKFSQSGNKGLDIAGQLGQPVNSAAPGKVVYSGSGLIGYGQLIIVKHNKSHLSAYAYNDRLLVKEGDRVKGGQRIATMGRSGNRHARLHFEIRKDGKPVDPLRYLPKM